MSTDPDIKHLVVEAGPEKGRLIAVPPEGGRIGRSSSNDMVLSDPSLSRFHCRVFFKPDGCLWVSDLKSTNETLVNMKPIQDVPLRCGDRIEIGETVIKVQYETLTGVPAAPEAGAEPEPEYTMPSPPLASKPSGGYDMDLDLGFKEENAPESRVKRPLRRTPLVAVALVMAILVALVYAIRLVGGKQGNDPGKDASTTASIDPSTLRIDYEKVEASTENIFHYRIEFDGEVMRASVDDLANGRHASNAQAVAPELVKNFIQTVRSSGFMSLDEEYTGLARDIHEAKDLAITIGRRHHRVLVLNRLEPDVFKDIRQALEDFATHELGLAALALPPEKLLELASEAFLQAQKLYAEREVRYGNLFQAIKSLQEAEWYLETIEPKPDYYGDIVARSEEGRRELQAKYDDHLFRSERATKLRDWETAAQHLRVICEMIPDRFEERHQKAQRKLLDVERRISR